MFTGLVEDRGEITRLEREGARWSALIEPAGMRCEELETGESVSIDGVCLTVTRLEGSPPRGFWVDVSPETLRRTTLGERAEGDRVHLERALRVGDRLGGHIVLGHVDGVGRLVSREREGNAWRLVIEAPEEMALYLVEKGSVAVDGVSLTINEVDGARFGLTIIPHTAEVTGICEGEAGQRRYNLETDYVLRWLARTYGPAGIARAAQGSGDEGA